MNKLPSAFGGAFADSPRVRPPASRLGVTLLEVLISIFVASVGLLGVLTLLPVAQSRVNSMVRNDMAGETGRAAWRMIRAHRFLDWSRIVEVKNPSNANTHAIGSGFRYLRPHVRQHAFVIDPLYHATWEKDQYMRTRDFPMRNYAGTTLALPRRTLSRASESSRMNLTQARNLFFLQNELNYKIENGYDGDQNDSQSARKQAVLQYERVPLVNRKDDTTQLMDAQVQIKGNYSWLITVSPEFKTGSEIYYDPHGVGTEMYNVAVVVFHQRDLRDTTFETEFQVEIVGNQIYGGGDLKLKAPSAGDFAPPANPDQNPPTKATLRILEKYFNFRAGNWLALLGSSNRTGTKVIKWYKIAAVDDTFPPSIEGNRYVRYLSVTGPRWDAANDYSETHAVVVPNTVGVYQKSMRLRDETRIAPSP